MGKITIKEVKTNGKKTAVKVKSRGFSAVDAAKALVATIISIAHSCDDSDREEIAKFIVNLAEYGDVNLRTEKQKDAD